MKAFITVIALFAIAFSYPCVGQATVKQTSMYANEYSQEEIARGILVMTDISREKGFLGKLPRTLSMSHPKSVDHVELAEAAYNLDQRAYGSVFVPLAIARHETGFRNLRGDHHLSDDGRGVSCGITQIRTDFEGRPSCDRLVRNPEYALEWTHNHLNRLFRSTQCISNGRCLQRYAGAGQRAVEFEKWVYNISDYVEEHLQQERHVAACLPVDLPPKRP